MTLAENVASGFTLAEVCTIKLNYPEADFWLVRRGTPEAVGEPTKEFSPEHYGIKVVRTDILVPGYLFYAMQYLHSQGQWRQLATGALRLVHIKLSDIAKIKLG